MAIKTTNYNGVIYYYIGSVKDYKQLIGFGGNTLAEHLEVDTIYVEIIGLYDNPAKHATKTNRLEYGVRYRNKYNEYNVGKIVLTFDNHLIIDTPDQYITQKFNLGGVE